MPKLSTSYSLRRDEVVGPGLIRVLKTMAENARNLSGRPVSQLPDSIHDLRTLIKRLRAILWFDRPVLGKVRYKQSNGVLCKAAARLSQARDLVAVQLALTKAAMPETNEEHLRSLVRVSQAFARKEAERKKSDEASLSPLKKAVGDVVPVIEQTIRVAKDRKVPSPRQRIKKAFRVARKARKKALRENQLPLVHEWRKKSKRLFYLLQLTKNLPGTGMAGCLEKVDKLQETLGEFQDGVVAENHLRRHPPDVDATDLDRTIRLLKKKRKLLLNSTLSHSLPTFPL